MPTIETAHLHALNTVADAADALRCAWEQEHWPSYDLANPIERAMALLTESLVALAHATESGAAVIPFGDLEESET